MPDVAILVVNYFSADDVAGFLRSIAPWSSVYDITVSVVDNSCDNDEAARLAASISSVPEMDVRLTLAPSNLGYGAGNNLAWTTVSDSLDCGVVIVANPDCRVLELDLTEALADCESAEPKLWAVRTASDGRSLAGISRLRRATGKSVSLTVDEATRLIHRDGLRGARTTYVDGHFFACSVRTWRAAGGFDGVFFLYCEELDLALRLRALGGLSLGILPGSAVSHRGGGSTGGARSRKSPVVARHANRSRVVLYQRTAFLRPWRHIMFGIRFVLSFRDDIGGNRQVARCVRAGLIEGKRVRHG